MSLRLLSYSEVRFIAKYFWANFKLKCICTIFIHLAVGAKLQQDNRTVVLRVFFLLHKLNL